MTSVVFGARGQFGKIIKILNAAADIKDVLYVSHSNYNYISPNGAIVWDFCDVGFLQSVFSDFLIDRVYYFSACHASHMLSGIDIKENELMHINYSALKHVISALLPHRSCDIVYFGSSQMYKFQGIDEPIFVDRKFNPSTIYGQSKVAAFRWLENCCAENINPYLFICCNHTSSHQSKKFLIPRLVSDMVNGKDISIENPMARIDLGSAEELIFSVIEKLNENRPGRYICGTGNSFSIKEIIDILAEKTKYRGNLSYCNPQAVPSCIAGQASSRWINTGTKGLLTMLDEMVTNVF